MKQMQPWVLRAVLLVLVAAIVPACTHDDDDDSSRPAQNPPPNPPPNNPPQTIVLFEEKFDGAYPGTAWTEPSANGPGPTAVVAGGEGNPAPSLMMTTSAGPDPLASGPLFMLTDSTITFADGPLTFNVDIKAIAAGEGSGSIAILDGTNTPIAAAEWHPTDSFGAVTFMIAGNTGSFPPPATGSYHTLTFSRNAGGTGTWSVDGGAAVLTQESVPPGPYKIRLYLMVESSSGPYATFHFDNVKVTTP